MTWRTGVAAAEDIRSKDAAAFDTGADRRRHVGADTVPRRRQQPQQRLPWDGGDEDGVPFPWTDSPCNEVEEAGKRRERVASLSQPLSASSSSCHSASFSVL